MGIKSVRLLIALTLTLSLLVSLSGSVQAVSDPDGAPAAAKQAYAAVPWTIRHVDPGTSFTEMTDRSLHLDSGRLPHIAYGEKYLYHAYYDGEWQTEIVDGNYGVGKYAALAIDSADTLHFSYYDAVNGDLRYARREGINNYISTFPSAEDEGAYTSIDLDPAGNPHISYYNITHGDLKYSYWTGTAWVTETIDTAGDVGTYTSLALDGAGNRYISYYDVTNGDLKVAHWTGAAWTTTVVDSTDDVGAYSSLALDSLGNPHISYYDATNLDLKYAHWDGGTWVVETVVSTGDVGRHTSLALDSLDKPRISYNDATNGELIYVQRWGAGWKYDTLDSTGGEYFSSIALGNDVPQFSFVGSHSLWHSRWGGSYYIQTQLDVSRTAGRYTSLAVDNAGEAHISYQSDRSLGISSHKDLAYAHVTSNSQALSVADYTWETGAYTSIALDTSANPAISYQDTAALRTKYAYWNGSTWVSQTVDSATSTTGNSSIALDVSNVPSIAYQTVGSQVKYARWNGAAWESVIVDQGTSPSLALDDAGNPHISYYNGAGLRYAHLVGTEWLLETVEAGQSGLYTSLALDSLDKPRISYGFGPLKYAAWTGSEWNIQTVDSSTNAGFYHSLALDDAGNPNISYTLWLESDSEVGCDIYDLKYTRWNGSTWDTQTIDTGALGEYNAIGLDKAGNPHISYYDCGNIELKYATADLRPTVDFSSISYSVDEGNGSANLTVMLTQPSNQTVTVDYATADGTATAGSDYTANAGTLTFAPGVTSRTFDISLTNDALDENNETVIMTLSNAGNAILGATNNPATLTINDNDPAPTVSFSSSTYKANEKDGTADIIVTLNAASGLTVTVDYSTANGTATAGEDYSAASGTLTFPPGTVSQTVNVVILDDKVPEGQETVLLSLSNPSNTTLGVSAAVLTLTEVFRLYVPLVRR